MTRPVASATQAANSWKTGFGSSGQKWIDGVNAVTTAPGLAAAAAKDRLLAGVQANLEKYATNVAAVTVGDWKAACANKGQARLASGAAAGMSKYQSKMGPVLQAISQIRDSLPPRGDIMTNLQRAQQLALGLHERAQQGW